MELALLHFCLNIYQCPQIANRLVPITGRSGPAARESYETASCSPGIYLFDEVANFVEDGQILMQS